MSEHVVVEDELDIRKVVLILWHHRYLLVSASLVVAVLVFAISVWFLPAQYRAVAYVTIGYPTVSYTTTEGLKMGATTLDIRALPEIAQSKTIYEQVKADERLKKWLPAKSNAWQPDAQVYSVGTSLLRFQVTDTNPERAALFVNVWAEKAADWIEKSYGIGEFAADLTQQIAQTKEVYSQAQAQVETFLTKDQTPIWTARLESLRALYGCLENQRKIAEVLLERLDGVEKNLSLSDVPLAANSMVVLTNMENSIFSLGTCGGADGRVMAMPSPAALSTAQALEHIQALRQILQSFIADTQKLQSAAEQEMLTLQTDLERISAQRNEYVHQRDQAKMLYEQLTYQQSIINGVLEKSGRVASIGISAQPPTTPVAPRPLLNAILAGVSVATLLSAIVLLRSTGSNEK